LARIYTRTGDAGETGLIGGARVGKDDPRVRAYGEVDELNAALGLARGLLGARSPAGKVLGRLQSELFELGAELAERGSKGRIGPAQARALEGEIDAWTAALPELKRFILPSGSPAGAALHLARGVCRRAERALVALSRREEVRPETLRYLNRLSDHLFTLARRVNAAARRPEAPWEPRGGG